MLLSGCYGVARLLLGVAWVLLGGCYGVVNPRNLNQKRTQTRPKAVGTICPSDVAGREI